MENINSCLSCEEFQKVRTVSVLGKELRLKNYICSCDGKNYQQKPKEIKLQLTICPTSFCAADCPFCIAGGSGGKEFIDLEKLRDVLVRLNEEKLIRGISFSGGEPFTDVSLLNDTIALVFEIFGLSMELSVTTNGTNLSRMHEIKQLSYLDALHISRHHDNDALNQRLFGTKVPSKDELKEILHSVSYRDLFVLNCMILKDYIATPADAHRFMDFAIDVGAGKVAFIACSPINAFAQEQYIDYTELLIKGDPSLLFTKGFYDFEVCRCQDGVYVSPSGDLIEFYGRNTSASSLDYCRGFVYGADNHLRTGFNGEIII